MGAPVGAGELASEMPSPLRGGPCLARCVVLYPQPTLFVAAQHSSLHQLYEQQSKDKATFGEMALAESGDSIPNTLGLLIPIPTQEAIRRS